MKIFHVLMTLLFASVRARIKRMRSSFSTPSRTCLSLVVLLLIVLWTGQTVAAMLFREPWPVERFRLWTAITIAMWTGWHFVRVAWRRPDQPVEWSESEEQQIVARPFHAVNRFLYRCGTVLTATLPKVMLTTFALWPDLGWFSPIGLLLVLAGLELFRMLMDAASCCLSKKGYLAYRIVVLCAAGGMALHMQNEFGQVMDIASGLTTIAENVVSDPAINEASPSASAILMEVIAGDPLSGMLLAPFLLASTVITAKGSLLTLLYHSSIVISVVTVIAVATFRFQEYWQQLKLQKERSAWASASALQTQSKKQESPFRLKGQLLSPLVWRQWKRATQYTGSLVISMLIPAVLLAPAAIAMPDPAVAFIVVVCGAFFYTFILLPEAIKFDFRLDSQYLVVLKALPLTAEQVVRGQLAVPVLFSAAFQCLLFVAVGWYRSVPIDLVMVAMALSVPISVVFVAIDNLIFLLFPHRPTQEGFEAFFRTILKFTGKSALLAAFAGLLLLWAPICRAVTILLALDSAREVFLCGLVAGSMLVACAAFYSVVATYRRFDVSAHSV